MAKNIIIWITRLNICIKTQKYRIYWHNKYNIRMVKTKILINFQ